MSYLALAKQAAARLRLERAGGGLGTSETAVLDTIVAMPLALFIEHGVPLEIRVSWYGQTLWFVPADRDAEALEQEGISRGRIWTANELLDLLTLPNLIADPLRSVALAKLEFSGTVVAIRALERPQTATSDPN